MKHDSDLKYLYNTKAVCPHCDYENEIDKEDDFPIRNDDEENMECGNCEKEFIVSASIDITYSTSK